MSTFDSMKALTDQFVRKRDALLKSLTSRKSRVAISVLSNGKTLLCVYKRHTATSVTVETTKDVADSFFLGGETNLLNSRIAQEVTFQLLDIAIEKI